MHNGTLINRTLDRALMLFRCLWLLRCLPLKHTETGCRRSRRGQDASGCTTLSIIRLIQTVVVM